MQYNLPEFLIADNYFCVCVCVLCVYLLSRCAGVCSYESKAQFCSIRLSLSLLKLRPRKDLVETLLVLNKILIAGKIFAIYCIFLYA